MAKSNFADIAQQYQRDDMSGNDYFTIVEGANRLRIMSGSAPISEHFKKGVCIGMEKGCPFHTPADENTGVKFLTWVLYDGKLKLAKLPYTVVKAIGSLQLDPEYAFEEVPMPYDITINAKGAGKITVEYTITAARQNTPIPDEIAVDYAKKTSPEDIVQRMKNNQAKKLGVAYNEPPKKDQIQDVPSVEYPEEPLSDIPF